MVQAQMSAPLEETARQLAAENAGMDDAIDTIYWFRHPEQIRLIEVDTTVAPCRPNESIAPYYFGARPVIGLPYPTAIALIAPEDALRAPLPPGWGEWSDAVVIWSRL